MVGFKQNGPFSNRPNSYTEVSETSVTKTYMTGCHRMSADEREKCEKEFYSRSIFRQANIAPKLINASVEGQLVTEVAGRQTLEVCRDEYFSAGKTKDLAEKLFVALLAVERLERKMARLNLRHGDLEMRHIFVTIIKGANNRYKGRTSAKLIDWETWQTESFRKDLIEWDKIKDTLLKTIGKEWYAKFCKKYRIPKKLPRIKIGTGLPKGKVRCPYCFEVVNIQELEYNEFAGAVICSDCAFHCNTEVPEYYDDALWE